MLASWLVSEAREVTLVSGGLVLVLVSFSPASCPLDPDLRHHHVFGCVRASKHARVCCVGRGGRSVGAGDWVCGSCGNNNFAHRTQCNKCGLPKPAGGGVGGGAAAPPFPPGGGAPGGPPGYAGPPGGGGGPAGPGGFGGYGPGGGAPGGFSPPGHPQQQLQQQQQQQYYQPPAPAGPYDQQYAPGQAYPPGGYAPPGGPYAPGPYGPPPGGDPYYGAPGGGPYGDPYYGGPHAGPGGPHGGPPLLGPGGKPPKPNDWICPSCQNINFTYRTQCNLCGKQRPEGVATVGQTMPGLVEGGRQSGAAPKPGEGLISKPACLLPACLPAVGLDG